MSLNDVPNIALVQTVLDGISFGHFPMPIEMKIVHGHVLFIRIKTCDRDTGAPCTFESHRVIPPWFQRPSDFEAVAEWLYQEVVGAFKHELREFMTYQGHRIFDPHKPEKNTFPMMPADLVEDLMGAMRRTGQGSKP